MISRTIPVVGTLIRARNVAASSNADVTVTVPAHAELCNYLHHIQWSYDGIPTGGKLTVRDGVGGTILWEQAITASGPGGQNPDELGTKNTAMVVTLSAGGSGVTGRLAGVRVILMKPGT